ncbi:triose-phosphate isomerase [Halioglobus sp. HI00S01]|uniref:triose-phosphate isomerase n=1 Tax=Halioglobus sp. HI00S01 TaxID=1822214 RepID=UPI0007C34520|nr:triose-phosphate isomerase [Halioglobus sp. HI00S01]KZX50340.1 triose-phosphate isomerase [Halioglobus sp. HI00S01]
MRRPLVAGNWKMHGSRDSVGTLLNGLMAQSVPETVDVAVCPTYVHLDQAVAACANSVIAVGAQDCWHAEPGAYTGDVAAVMLKELGCEWVILGHSERRSYHAEADALIAAKLQAAAAAGLKPIVCVGETLDQRESGEAEAVVARQLRGSLEGAVGTAGLVIAYEPVWAIGTGLTASPEQAQQMHAFIRKQLQDLGVDAQQTRILYGGSVKPGNAGELFAQDDIDGALVGGAALKAEDFNAIIAAAG